MQNCPAKVLVLVVFSFTHLGEICRFMYKITYIREWILFIDEVIPPFNGLLRIHLKLGSVILLCQQKQLFTS